MDEAVTWAVDSCSLAVKPGAGAADADGVTEGTGTGGGAEGWSHPTTPNMTNPTAHGRARRARNMHGAYGLRSFAVHGLLVCA